MPTQISILELLKVSPMHKEILEKALVETIVSKYLDIDQFKNMVGHLIAPHCLSFSENDDASLQHPHNAPLHVEVTINKTRVKHVLIDGGAGLNICALSLIKALGYSKNAVDPKKKITIKDYDEVEHSSKGTVVLPIKMGPVERNTLCQLLDLNLSYNILLGRPWIHNIQEIPSTYHQCVKFHHEGQEITIIADSSQYCNNLKPT
ncbi:hypothetical protein SUGI_0888550 [Cryptomeria japonica]|nr:hypothetical protein SUGI_0888550 [Cryptomeria japonica]